MKPKSIAKNLGRRPASGSRRVAAQLRAAPAPAPLLLHRKYLELVEPEAAGQFSVRLGAEGNHGYFPLGEQEQRRAAERASELQRVLQREGWAELCRRFRREFTLALFWHQNPLLCTYTTLISDCRGDTKQASVGATVRVGILERDDQVRRGLESWVRRLPGWSCAGAFPSADPGTVKALGHTADLILFNRSQTDPRPWSSGEAASFELSAPAFPFGIYETSDDIFIAHSGVSSGYFLRRTHPQHILDPIRDAWTSTPPDVAQLPSHVDRYFQALIADRGDAERIPAKSALTPREQEILLRLSKGFADKQIAAELNISSWTVHNHMKNIFRKLGVHTRTQAVLKYLQR
jgi:DNA-binding NarL/FixJ family response regulator